MLKKFFDQYFIQPIYVEQGYNLINTTVYAIITLALLYLIYKILQHTKFKMDLKFFVSMIPFIFLGSSIRAFVDNNYIPRSFWFISPGIWILIAAIFLVVFFINYFIELKAKFPYWTFCLIIGSAAVIGAYAAVFDKIQLTNFIGALVILTIFFALAVGLYSFGYSFKLAWITHRAHFLALTAHLFDATNTFIIVDFFGGLEKHPIPHFFIEYFGTGLIFYPLKLIVLLPAIYLIYTELKDRKQLRNFLLIAIAVLGFSEGLRNFISLVLA